MKPTDIKNPEYFHKVVDCQYACPAHTPVPEYIRMIAAQRYTDAYAPVSQHAGAVESVVKRNRSLFAALNALPLTIVTKKKPSRVCRQFRKRKMVKRSP